MQPTYKALYSAAKVRDERHTSNSIEFDLTLMDIQLLLDIADVALGDISNTRDNINGPGLVYIYICLYTLHDNSSIHIIASM